MTDAMARAGLTCPKCGGQMRTYERSGVTVDQCSDCRGVFLDRGELERLVDAEGAYYERASREDRDDRYRDDRDDRYGDDRYRDDHRTGGKRKRKGFLGDLFEFGD